MHCGVESDLLDCLMVVQGREPGSHRPVSWIECVDVESCIARVNEKKWRNALNNNKEVPVQTLSEKLN
jgi:hypothetical protein